MSAWAHGPSGAARFVGSHRYGPGMPDELLDDEGHPDASAIIGKFWHRDGPHTPESVRSAALAIDELTHYLARATWRRHVLPSGPALYEFVGELRSAIGRLDQVLDQAARHAGALVDDPTLYDDRRDGRDPAQTAREVQGGLDAARVVLGPVAEALGQTHSASGHLGHDT
ncbi:hypothetical protein GCM10023175_53490 [Pseudonocardia xishanensis]|uniref:SAV-6107-like HEPN domain-containing protein n=2 Tax=Pseudonocardiaceae TaxID=2070 RepID=A0ABP8RZN3_9PSEU